MRSPTGANGAYDNRHPRQKVIVRSIVENLIVTAGLPISIVESDGFRKFLNDVDPQLQPPCRKTVTHKHLPQLLDAKRAAISEHLSSADNIALTLDIWTDRRQHSYLAITAHTFDILLGRPNSVLVLFRTFKGSHTGVSIADAIEQCISEYSMQEKVHYIITDNASNMRKALSLIFAPGPRGNIESWLQTATAQAGTDSLLCTEDSDSMLDDATLYEDTPSEDVEHALVGERLACFAHSLQLTVRDGLQKTAVSRTAVAKCCKIASMVHQSANFKSSFEDTFGNGRSVPTSNDTRWNSVWRQISCIVGLDSAKLNELLRKENHTALILTNKETQQLRELTDILQPFAEATDLSQGDTYVTISYVVPLLMALQHKLQSQLATVRFHQ